MSIIFNKVGIKELNKITVDTPLEHIVDIWSVNATFGNISYQFLASGTVTVDFFYSNYTKPPKGYPNEELDLWIPGPTWTLEKDVPKNDMLTIPISRFIKVVVTNKGTKDVFFTGTGVFS